MTMMTNCTHDPRGAKVRTPDGVLHCYWCWGATLPKPKTHDVEGDPRRGLCKVADCPNVAATGGEGRIPGYCTTHSKARLPLSAVAVRAWR